jgi:hypothetical protein
MSPVRDFRTLAFDAVRIDASGKNLGGKVYWQLYSIENIVRVIANTIFTAELGPTWWSVAVDPKMRGRIDDRRADYTKQPWHSTPGKHDIYYAQLPELTKVIANNSDLFRRPIPKIDEWVKRLEEIRLPRNVVGHMNWLSPIDRKRLDVLHSDLQALVQQLSGSGLTIIIPAP